MLKLTPLKLLFGQRGDSFVSVLLAAGILSGTAVVGGGVVKLMRKDQTYTTAISTAIAAESAILQALQNPNTYANPTHTSNMRDGGTNLLAGVAINGERGILGAGSVLAVIGQERQLSRAGTACNPSETNPIREDFCAITTKVRIDCATGGTCKAAYQVVIDKRANDNSPVPPLGSQNWDPQPADFTTVISYDLYRRGGATMSCTPAELFVSAVNKSNGSVTCARPAVASLAPNQVPDGVVYNTATESLELRARDLGQATCPDSRYALQAVDPRSLDQGASTSGTCVYRFHREIPWMDTWPSGRDEVIMNVCPQADYNIVPTGRCTMNVISQTEGWCTRICQDETGRNYDCSEAVPPNIVEGVNYVIEQDPPVGAEKNGAEVTCRLRQIGTQPCQASWQGEVQWSGRCRLNQPATIPATRR